MSAAPFLTEVVPIPSMAVSCAVGRYPLPERRRVPGGAAAEALVEMWDDELEIPRWSDCTPAPAAYDKEDEDDWVPVAIAASAEPGRRGPMK